MQRLFHAITQLLCFVFLLGALYGILGKGALPGSEVFALVALALGAHAGGVLVSCIRLPPLVGMLAVGILYRNLPGLPFDRRISKELAATLRDVSLVIILLKAGLGLDADKLRTLKGVVLRLSFVPCLLETAAYMVLAHFLLGLPWLWALMLGFILSAVSAAVLVPGALALEEKKLGTDQGIPTLLMAAVSLDNIAALTGFIVVFNIITANVFSAADLGWTVLQRLLEPCLGFILGATFGILMWYFPDDKSNSPGVTYYRALLLGLGGAAFTFISDRMGVSGVGALGCVSLAFFASLKWKKNVQQFDTIKWITGLLWLLIEPFLFGLIGAEVSTESLRSNIGYGTAVLLGGVSVRMLSTVLAVQGSGLDLKEKVFVSASWMAKATVQAAVGSQALDYAKTEHKGSRMVKYGNQVLTMSVLAIILTAPLGAAFMDMLAKRLLKKPDVAVTEFRPESHPIPIPTAPPGVTNYGSFQQEKGKVIGRNTV